MPWIPVAGQKNKEHIKHEKMHEIETNTKIMSFTFYCGRLERTMMLDFSKISIIAIDQECSCCGSHGYKIIEVECPCGMTHNIEIESW